MMRLRVDADNAVQTLGRVNGALPRALSKWLMQGAEHTKGLMQKDIRDKAKNPKGQLAASIQTSVGPGRAIVEPTVDYAKFVDQPTRPHTIEPKNAQALAFPRAGARMGERGGNLVSRFTFGGKTATKDILFRKRVHHPGTRGMFFIRDTAQEAEAPLQRLLDRIVTQEARSMGVDMATGAGAFRGLFGGA